MTNKCIKAAKALIEDVKARYPGEELRCQFMKDLEAALPNEKTRHNYIGAPEAYSLDQVANFVNKAFGDICYLAGSATETRDFRDVDVRMIFSNEKYIALFGDTHGGHSYFWSLLCVSVSEYMSKRTGLRIDFQIQKRANVTEKDQDSPRSALGLFYSAESDPAWKKIEGI